MKTNKQKENITDIAQHIICCQECYRIGYDTARKELFEEIEKTKIMVEGKRDKNRWWTRLTEELNKLKELKEKQ